MISSAVVATVATPFHGSSGSLLGLDTSAPSMSPAASGASSMAVTTPPSWRVVGAGPAPHGVLLEHGAQPVARRPTGELPVGDRRRRTFSTDRGLGRSARSEDGGQSAS